MAGHTPWSEIRHKNIRLSGALPEGLHLDTNDGYVVVRDAQDHVWLRFEGPAFGDPEEWDATIRKRVLDALEIREEDA